MDNYRLRSLIVGLVMGLTVIWILPNMTDVEKLSWWPSKATLNYGLDIQGGLHLVMGVDVDGVVAESTTRMVVSLREELKKEGLTFKEVNAKNPATGHITVETESDADARRVRELIDKNHATVLQSSLAGSNVELQYFDSYLVDYKDKVIQQAIETIRNRIDEFGVTEPSITQQGASRILVQLPGMADAERAKELINTTAKLDFMIVSNEIDMPALQAMIAEAEKAGNYSLQTVKYGEYVTRLNKDLEGKIPAKSVVYFEKAANAQRMEDGAVPFLLKADTNLGGKDLDNAFVSYGQFGEPEVALRFNPAGGAVFADLTGNNVGRQMAIVLDRIVKSAPSLRERIGGGSAVITLGGRNRDESMNEAKMISTSLRAGALPATLEQLEERRVGPSLGADSVQKAALGSYIGAAIVILFMLIKYRAMGVISTIGILINVLMVFALLTTFGATLTLPGIAGIALTVGCAIDANVLINERMREELARGANWRLAAQEGYSKAMSAILDSNITTAAVAVVLLYFGTGPIRGFAVTLLVGIATTMFANVFVCKWITDTLIHRFGVQKMSV